MGSCSGHKCLRGTVDLVESFLVFAEIEPSMVSQSD